MERSSDVEKGSRTRSEKPEKNWLWEEVYIEMAGNSSEDITTEETRMSRI